MPSMRMNVKRLRHLPLLGHPPPLPLRLLHLPPGLRQLPLVRLLLWAPLLPQPHLRILCFPPPLVLPLMQELHPLPPCLQAPQWPLQLLPAHLHRRHPAPPRQEHRHLPPLLRLALRLQRRQPLALPSGPRHCGAHFLQQKAPQHLALHSAFLANLSAHCVRRLQNELKCLMKIRSPHQDFENLGHQWRRFPPSWTTPPPWPVRPLKVLENSG
mmetsp:Transcript_58748/g.139992  ORF Transcript_58748/g.139992 Transcript_58748/m.139992 type:complete len:213 (+) Transcript_58748:148-786(+)